MIKKVRAILLGGLLLTLCNPLGLYQASATVRANGNYYYVSIFGFDTNPGTQTNPWRTIQKAADTMVAGDSVTVLAGNYNERVQVTRSGASDTPITYRADGIVVTKGFTVQADYITIRGFEVTNTPNLSADGVGIFIEGSYCIVEENYVHYATRGGILIYTEPGEDTFRTNCLIRNNLLYRNAMYGIEIHGRNHIVEGNEISHTIQYHPTWVNPPDWVDADGIRFHGVGHLIRRNYIHDITYGDPENVDPYIDCFMTFEASPYHEAASNIIIEQNICQVAESLAPGIGGTALALTRASHLTIRNNILHAWNHVGAPAGNSNLIIVNNVMTSDLSLPIEHWPEGIWMQDCPNTTIKNNIFFDLPAHIYWIPSPAIPGLDIGYNIAYRSDGQPVWDEPYPHDLWDVNPLFVNALAKDYHLRSTSPAIDAGYNLGTVVLNDYDGNTRPKGFGYDIGAYEYIQYSISFSPPVVHKNDTFKILINFASNENPIAITSILPTQLDYLSGSATCPATVTYNENSRTVTLSGNPLPAANCKLQIDVKVNTDQKVAITILATINDSFSTQSISSTIVINGLPSYLPLMRK